MITIAKINKKIYITTDFLKHKICKERKEEFSIFTEENKHVFSHEKQICIKNIY